MKGKKIDFCRYMNNRRKSRENVESAADKIEDQVKKDMEKANEISTSLPLNGVRNHMPLQPV